jgi:hypothetical protein
MSESDFLDRTAFKRWRIVMRTTVLAVLAAAFATSAEAKPLALDGSYGDDYGRSVARLGDVKAASTGKEPADWVLVTPRDATGHEWSCSFQSAHGSKVTASCANGGDAKASSQIVTVVENRSTRTLIYTDMAGTFTLHRCK